MAGSKENFTFFWKIRNFSFFINISKLISPTFLIKSMSETKWKLTFFSKDYVLRDCFACYFQRRDDRGPEQFKLDYELAFLANDGSVLHAEKYHQKGYKKETFEEIPLFLKREDMLMIEALLVPDDTLTIRCRIWDKQEPNPTSVRCFAETQIETECLSFTGNIKNFSNSRSCKKSVCIETSSIKKIPFFMNLYVLTNGKLAVEMELFDKCIERYNCNIFILDALGIKTKFGYGEFYSTKPQRIDLALSKECLMENKDQFLPDDVLTIKCEITSSTGKKIVDEPQYEFDYKDTREKNMNATYFTSKEHCPESPTTLMDDLTLLFSEGILYDTKLKTATVTFPAHTIVLSARSPVFKSMLTSCMKEKINKCVDIDDLDADTVRRMLSFMYTDTLSDLEYDSAKSLYFAADKYNIISLKHRCSNFLKQNLQLSNSCDTLLLADQHQDKDLKISVQDFIAKNDEMVLFSDEWENLEKNHSQLAIEVFRAVYLKNRKS